MAICFRAAGFPIRANLLFVGIRYKYLGYKTSEASAIDTAGLCLPPSHTRFQFLTICAFQSG